MNVKSILGLATIGLVLYTMYEQNNAINRLKDAVKNSKDTQYIDSVNLELFNAKTTIGRYEIALDNFKEVDSLSAAKFENILEHETE